MTRLKAAAALLILVAAAAPASAETYSYPFSGSFGGSTLGASYAGELYMYNTPTHSETSASASATGSWMGTSYSLFTAAYEAENTLGSGSASIDVTYMGSVVYHKSLAKSWKWTWSKSKTVFDESWSFSVFGVPVTIATDCKWTASASLNIVLTPTGCGSDGTAKFALTANGSAGVSLFGLSGSLKLKVTVIEVKPSGELNANFDYLYASGSVTAKAEIDLDFVVTFFGYTIFSYELYHEWPYSKTWTWTKPLGLLH